MKQFPNFLPELHFTRFPDRKIVNWFPGHMAKSIRLIKERLDYIDYILEVRDSRLPLSSKNKTMNEIFKEKKKIIIFNKCDLISQQSQKIITNYFEQLNSLQLNNTLQNTLQNNPNTTILFTSAKENINVNKIVETCLQKNPINKKFKTIPHTFLIAGIPNVGKSSIINKLINKKKAKEGALPGVTRNLGFFPMNTNKNCLLLDTPGIFQPDIDSNEQGFKLALINAVPDKLFGSVDSSSLSDINLFPLIDYLLFQLNKNYCFDYVNLFDCKEPLMNTDLFLEFVCKKLKMYAGGGQLDLNKAMVYLLKLFRTGKLGKINLDLDMMIDPLDGSVKVMEEQLMMMDDSSDSVLLSKIELKKRKKKEKKLRKEEEMEKKLREADLPENLMK
ncbi:hypothetical protein ABK040_011125 [Willaertia magna]